jgi:hypothetical protein
MQKSNAYALAGLLGALAMLASGPTHAQSIGVATSPAPPLSAKDKQQCVEEEKEGAEGAKEVAQQMKMLTDPAILKRVNDIGQKLAAVADTTTVPAEFGNDRVYPFTYHFAVVDSKDVNAFSLPGGYIFVNSGLIDAVRSDDELAGVLGHEMTHSAHHHVVTLSHIANSKFGAMNLATMAAMLAAMFSHNGNTGQAAAGLAEAGQYAELGIMNNTYSEQAERDADHGGTILMQKAGYNPVAMLTFMERLGDFEDRQPQLDEGIFENHPPAPERIVLIRSELGLMHVAITPQAVRAVSGGFRASVTSGAHGTSEVVFDKEAVATLADPDGSRAKSAVDLLNSLLDNGLQAFQIEANGATLIAANRPVLTFTPADTAIDPGSTPTTLATQAYSTLQKGLWDQSFVVGSP